MAQKLRIDFVSDISCSWCAVGLRNLEEAIEKFGDDLDVELQFRPFELNPDMPSGGQNLIGHLNEKYGWSEQDSLRTFQHVRSSGEPVGIEFRLDEDSRIHNTFDAHRLLHWAHLHGRQKELKRALFAAHFEEGSDVGDHEVLASLVESVGLSADEARHVLASGAYAEDVRADERIWIDAGVTAVPAMVFNHRYAVTGAQPAAALGQVIARALASSLDIERAV